MTGPRILCVAPRWLGDAVLSRPAVAALGRAGATVDVLAPPALARVLADLPGVRRVQAAPAAHGPRLAAALRLRGERYDAGLVLAPSFSAALAARWAGARTTVGWVGDLRTGLLTRALPAPGRDEHLAVQYLRLAGVALAAAGCCEPPDAPGAAVPAMPPLWVEAAEERAARALIAGLGLGSEPYLVVAPGARYGPAKRWPPAGFAAAAHDLSRRLAGAVLLVGETADAPATRAVRAALPSAHDLAGRTTLAELVGLLGGAEAVLANDSGTMHLAAALGRPVVGVFGSSNPAWTRPIGPLAAVATNPVWCAPCYSSTCAQDFACMLGITPQTVVDTLLATLELGRIATAAAPPRV